MCPKEGAPSLEPAAVGQPLRHEPIDQAINLGLGIHLNRQSPSQAVLDYASLSPFSRTKPGYGPGDALAVEEGSSGTRFVLMAGKPHGETSVFK